jgi:hypothetical protein
MNVDFRQGRHVDGCQLEDKEINDMLATLGILKR